MAFNGISPVCFESVSAVTATPSVELGTVRETGGEKYVYIYNCGGGSASVGLAMNRPASAAAGMYSCAVSSISGDTVQGFVKHAAIAAGSYGWLLKRGLVTVAVASGASSQSGGSKSIGADGVIATAGAGYAIVGELTTAIVSGNSGSLYVNLA